VFKGQTDFIHFDFSNAFGFVPQALLHHKVNNYDFSYGYINWFLSHLRYRQSRACYSGILSSPFVVQSGVPERSALQLLLFSIFINDLCDLINHSICLLLADNLVIYRAISSPCDCLFLQLDIVFIIGVRQIL
jgi:hypothetical protein